MRALSIQRKWKIIIRQFYMPIINSSIMLNTFQEGQILELTVGDIQTYVVVVSHIFPHRLGFKSLFALETAYSISIDQLQHYQVRMVGTVDVNYQELANCMPAAKKRHLLIWERFNPEGHYRSDLALAELHSKGVVTSTTPRIIGPDARN